MKYVQYDEYKFLLNDIKKLKKIGIEYLYPIEIVSIRDFSFDGNMNWLLYDKFIFASECPLEKYQEYGIAIPYINSKIKIDNNYPIKGFQILNEKLYKFKHYLIIPVMIDERSLSEKENFFESFFNLHKNLIEIKNTYIPDTKNYWTFTFSNFNLKKKLLIEEILKMPSQFDLFNGFNEFNEFNKINRIKKIKI
jgi:hypothetical protein